MTTLNEYLAALHNSEAQTRLITIDEEIQRGADPLRKGNEALGLYTEKKTFKLRSLTETEIQEMPVPDPNMGVNVDANIDAIRALLAQGWVVKDMSLRLEKPNN